MLMVSDVSTRLASLSARAAAWDRVGLQLGDPTAEIGGVGVCHEVTDEVIERAIAGNVDLLVAYHPLLFAPTTSLVAGASPAGRAHRLIASGIALHVVHTGWDVHPGGTADALAEALELGEVEPFGVDDGTSHFKIATFAPWDHEAPIIEALSSAGAGRIGDYTSCSFSVAGTGTFEPGPRASPTIGEAGMVNHVEERRIEMIAPIHRKEAVVRALLSVHPYEEPAFELAQLHPETVFIGRVGSVAPTTLGQLEERARRVLDYKGIRRAGAPSTRITRVAVVPGSGSGFIPSAQAAGADALITGDVSHHRAVEALNVGLALLDVGHEPGERPGMAKLYDAVSSRLDVPVLDLTDVSTNPWESA